MALGQLARGLVLGLTLALVAASQGAPEAAPRATFHSVAAFGALGTSSIYAKGVHRAAADGLHVWLDADLAAPWLAGSTDFQAAIQQIKPLATIPGVVGVKIADQLGYQDGFTSASQIQSFLTETATAMRSVAPGKLLLVDFVVPQLGCAPGAGGSAATPAAACSTAAAAKYPALTLQQVGKYLASGSINVVDLGSNLLSAQTYLGWGLTLADAQRAAWEKVQNLGWENQVRVDSRKALAFHGRCPYTRRQARALMRLYANIPINNGATGADIWTWHRLVSGQLLHLMNPGLKPNPLWDAIVARHRRHVKLMTQFSPTSVAVSIRADLRALSHGFGAALVAAGTG